MGKTIGVLGVLLATGLLSAADNRVWADPNLAETRWGSEFPCTLEMVRFNRDGTAQIIYDSVYDFVDVDDAVWSQRSGMVYLKVSDDEEAYAGKFEGGAIHLTSVLSVDGSRQAPQALSCTFRRNG